MRVFDTLGGPAAIEAHTAALGRYLYEQAARLRHSNGAPLLEIYGNHARPDRCGARVWAHACPSVSGCLAAGRNGLKSSSRLCSHAVACHRVVPCSPEPRRSPSSPRPAFPPLQRGAPGLHPHLQPAGPYWRVLELARRGAGHDGGWSARAERRNVQSWDALHVHRCVMWVGGLVVARRAALPACAAGAATARQRAVTCYCSALHSTPIPWLPLPNRLGCDPCLQASPRARWWRWCTRSCRRAWRRPGSGPWCSGEAGALTRTRAGMGYPAKAGVDGALPPHPAA